MAALPYVEVGHMDTRTGAYVRDGEVSAAYLTACGVRVRVTTHRWGDKAEADITIDPHWTEDNRVNSIDVIEIRATDHQAAIRVAGSSQP